MAKTGVSKSSKKNTPMVKSGSGSKSARGGKTTRTTGRGKAPAHKFSPRWSWHSLSPERKLDVLGVILALVGLLTVLSLFSAQHGSASGWLVDGLHKVAGWGAFVLPIALIAIGLWLVFRNIERLPVLSPERLVGVILLYLNILAWIHILVQGGFELAAQGQGGGYIGAVFEWALVSSLGFAGALVVLIAWLLIALAFMLDLSIPELFRYLADLWQDVRAMVQARRETQNLQLEANAQPGFSGEKDYLSSNNPVAGIQSVNRPAAGGMPANSPASRTPSTSTLPPSFHPIGEPLGRSLSPAGSSAQNGVVQPDAVQAETAGETPEGNSEEDPGVFQGSGSGASLTMTVPPVPANWVLPSIADILDLPEPASVLANADQERGRLIEETLASFGAPAHVIEVHRGPTVTQFGVEPDFIETRSGRTRVRVGKIASLADDLALALAAPRIRIQAPVPGHNYVGIEVPNTEVSRVTLREVIESEGFQRLKSPLRFALGKDVSGKACSYDLTNMPHLLIAGTTGSGKSVCVNAILAGFLLNNSPADLRLILVDPKRVELTGYNGIPHLLAPVVTDAEKVVNALQWMLREMDTRYHKFSKEGVRNIQEYNGRHPDERIPYLVIVIDELADLMMLAPEETERSITRLAQLARATGIHLILATQRPSTDVVTGLIKANFPARIAFAVASNIDSRVILDQPGAERLLGRGDMLFQAPDAAAPMRLQGVFVTDAEIQRLVDYWRFTGSQFKAAQPVVMGGPIDSIPAGVPLKQISFLEEEQDGDPLLKEAIELVRKEGRASITMLQRRMRIGYTRAARLVDMMEEKGIVGPPQTNSQVREVLDYGKTAPPEDDGY